MTETPSWQPPVPTGAAPAPASPWVAPQSAPPVAPPPTAQPGGGQQSWAPPPKPGLIPLHPLSFGTILGSSFRVMRRNPAPTFGLSVLLYGVVTILYIGVLAGVIAYSFGRISAAAFDDQDAILAGSFGLFALASIIPIALTVVATGILQGIISLEVARATLGEKLRIRGLFRLAKGRILALVGWSLLLTAAVVVFLIVATAVAFVVFAGAGATFSSGNDAVLAFLGAFGALAIVALGFGVLAAWLGTKLALVPTAIVLERLPLRAAMARSWSLTHRNFWRTLGTQLLISVIINIASSIVTYPLSLIGSVVIGLTNPGSDPTAAFVSIGVLYLIIGIVSIVVGSVGLVMQSAAYSLIYIDIRMRREGLDLELMHFVEARQAGTPGVGNPYEPRSTAPAPPTGSPWA